MRKNQRNYYRVLFVQPDAPTEIIQASYRTLMQKLKAHPDLGGDEWIATIINEAFETLSDPEKRRAYDRKLFRTNDIGSLGLQEKRQRSGTENYTIDVVWEKFRPRSL